MPCTKCHQTPKIPDKPGVLISSCDSSEITQRFAKFLQHENLAFQQIDCYTLTINIPSLVQYLSLINRTSFFTKTQLQAVNLLFLDNLDALQPNQIRNIKPLRDYLNLFKTQVLIPILDNENLTIHFQPIINLMNQQIYGYEALSRGFAETGAVFQPEELIQMAAKGEMLFMLDRTCRENAIKAAAVQKIAKPLFINFSPTSIYDPIHCLVTTVKLAKSLAIDPKQVIFEVIKFDEVDDIDHLKHILNFYQHQGFSVCLDDINGSMLSLEMLNYLQPDYIKLKSSLIRDIQDNAINQKLIELVLDTAKKHDICVIAKGIETAKEHDYCQTLGIHYGQGFHLGKPKPSI